VRKPGYPTGGGPWPDTVDGPRWDQSTGTGGHMSGSIDDHDTDASGMGGAVLAAGQERSGPEGQTEPPDSPAPVGGDAQPLETWGNPSERLPGRREAFAQALAAGASVAEARQRLGISAETAGEWATEAAVASRVVHLAAAAVKGAAGAAARKVQQLLGARSERVQLEAALAILDRAGVGESVTQGTPAVLVLDLGGGGGGVSGLGSPKNGGRGG